MNAVDPQESHTWSPDWSSKLEQRIRAMGFGSIADLLRHYPARPYAELAELIDPSVAPIQIVSLQFKAARSDAALREAAIDCLIRNIRRRLPAGWGVGENVQWQQIKSLAGWKSDITATGELPELKHRLDAVTAALRVLSVPPEWLPADTNDPVLRKAFDKGWPADHRDENDVLAG